MGAEEVKQQLRHRTLLAFRLVFETASVTRAAERLAVTQPAVSQLIGGLERAVGAALFERGPGRRLVPTAAARELYADACRALDALDAFEAAARALADRSGRRLAVAAEPALAGGFVRAVVGRLLRAAPHTDVVIDAAYSREREDGLLRGALDLALASVPPASARLASTR
ncbi:MAG: LysR family transcriptional regulator, partial [Alphaproteobacteria bacterium]|nr:LysR family transcriptional regulator [Alphaproteobacteria bacterium]